MCESIYLREQLQFFKLFSLKENIVLCAPNFSKTSIYVFDKQMKLQRSQPVQYFIPHQVFQISTHIIIIDIRGTLFTFPDKNELIQLQSGVQNAIICNYCSQQFIYFKRDQNGILMNQYLDVVIEKQNMFKPILLYLLSQKQGEIKFAQLTMDNVYSQNDIIEAYSDYIQLNFKQNQMITPLLQCQKQLLLHIQMNAVIHFIKRQDSEQVSKILTEQNTSADALLKICIQNKFAHLAYMLFNYTDFDASQFIDFLFKCFSPDLALKVIENYPQYSYKFENINLIYPVLYLSLNGYQVPQFTTQTQSHKFISELLYVIDIKDEKIGLRDPNPVSLDINWKSSFRLDEINRLSVQQIQEVHDIQNISIELHEALCLMGIK
ncbi:Conserved_hypothetical protein [Hexamita inflata]|uniref:Uncharacterized protein n=1 Tax=Hexamita inflata TaxID=28002 RepID=A0AA86NZ47_9EUKA|nr:Conserved hypothetical protein [Hexamita inflata]